jgi:hypothetical protein
MSPINQQQKRKRLRVAQPKERSNVSPINQQQNATAAGKLQRASKSSKYVADQPATNSEGGWQSPKSAQICRRSTSEQKPSKTIDHPGLGPLPRLVFGNINADFCDENVIFSKLYNILLRSS